MTDPRLQALRGRLRALPDEIRAAGGLRVWLLYAPGPGPALMSWLRKRWVLFCNPHVRIKFRGQAYLGPGFSLNAPRGGTLIVGDGVEFRHRFRAELNGRDAWVSIGAGTVFANDALVQCSSSIEVGAHCHFGHGTLLVDGSHPFRQNDPQPGRAEEPSPLTIGDSVTVTAKCTVITDIGAHTLVGANSVVTEPLPSHVVAAGAPATVIAYLGAAGDAQPVSP